MDFSNPTKKFKIKLGDAGPNVLQVGRPKTSKNTFAATFRETNAEATKAQIDTARKIISKENDWSLERVEYKTPINVGMLERYYSLCEKKENKVGGLMALEKAKENDGVLVSNSKIKYNCGRRYSEGPSPAKMDRGSRTMAMEGTGVGDGDQVNSCIRIVYFIAVVLAMDQ